MIKTHAELNVEFLAAALDCSKYLQEHINFLEELKVKIQDIINLKKEIMGDDYIDNTIRVLNKLIILIEQFQAEQKVNNE